MGDRNEVVTLKDDYHAACSTMTQLTHLNTTEDISFPINS